MNRFSACLPLWIALSLTLVGCGADHSEEIVLLENQITELQTQLETLQLKQDQDTTSGRMTEVTGRMGEMEEDVSEAIENISTVVSNQNDSFQRMQELLRRMSEVVSRGQTDAVFLLEEQGVHKVARSVHGSFLFELIDRVLVDGGVQVQFRVGNPTGFHVHQFRISGEFGEVSPDLTSEMTQADIEKLRSRWEASLRAFDSAYIEDLPPYEWTNVDLVIPNAQVADLAMLRFRFDVQRLSLNEDDEENMTAFSANSRDVHRLDTPYGAYPMTVEGVEEVDGGYEVEVNIGNPLGMPVIKFEVVGRFGGVRPELADFEDYEVYSRALTSWYQGLQEFENEMEEELVAFHWTPIKLKIPTPDRAKLNFIEMRLELQNIVLRNPVD